MRLAWLLRPSLVAASCFVLVCSSQAFGGQTTVASPSPAGTAYLAAFRTPAHVNRSSPAVFNQAVDAVVEFLRSSGVALANDPLREPSQFIPRLQMDMSREDLLAEAQEDGATYLLVLTVDRPIWSSLKLELECFDGTGKLLWKAVASDGALRTQTVIRKTLEKLKPQLQARLGQPGLPLVTVTQDRKLPAAPPAVVIQPPVQEVPGNAANAATWTASEPKASLPECQEAKADTKPLLPYILRADKHEKINYEGETVFWTTLVASYPNAVKTLNSCYAAVSAAGEWKDAAQVGIILAAVEKLRGDAIGWVTGRQLQESTAVRKEVLAYIGRNQRQALETARYIGQLEGELSELQAREGKQASYRNFADTLLLLKALTPPSAPRVIVQPRAVIPELVSRSVHCIAQPTITGQTFINCY